MKDKRDKIEHQGVVESVEGDHVRVNILQVAACSECKARSLCSSSESKEKLIDVYEQNAAQKYRIGESVKVCGTLSMGKQAVRMAFVDVCSTGVVEVERVDVGRQSCGDPCGVLLHHILK